MIYKKDVKKDYNQTHHPVVKIIKINLHNDLIKVIQM